MNDRLKRWSGRLAGWAAGLVVRGFAAPLPEAHLAFLARRAKR